GANVSVGLGRSPAPAPCAPRDKGERNMAGIDDILNLVSVDEVAEKLGVSPDVAKQAIAQGGAAILGGLQQNASTPEGSAAIEKALAKHTGQGDSVSLASVDVEDGEKILGHVFGGDKKKVTKKLEEQSSGLFGGLNIDFGQLLPVLAPIVMGMLAKGGEKQSSGGGGLDLGGILGNLLGGGKESGGLDLGGILGGLFGGKR